MHYQDTLVYLLAEHRYWPCTVGSKYLPIIRCHIQALAGDVLRRYCGLQHGGEMI